MSHPNASFYQFGTLEEEINYLRHLLCDVIEQNCKGRGEKGIDSGFIRSQAEAIRYLCSYDYLTLDYDTGPFWRGVTAKAKRLEDRGKV